MTGSHTTTSGSSPPGVSHQAASTRADYRSGLETTIQDLKLKLEKLDQLVDDELRKAVAVVYPGQSYETMAAVEENRPILDQLRDSLTNEFRETLDTKLKLAQDLLRMNTEG